MSPRMFIGQGIGIVAVILMIISFQMKTQKKLLLVQTACAFLLCVHYFMLEAYTASAMNFVGTFRNYIFCYIDKKKTSGIITVIFFTVLMFLSGLLSWQSPVSLLMIIGLTVNTAACSLSNAQTFRKTILGTSSLILLHNILVFSVGGIFTEISAITSSLIGLYRFSGKRQAMQKGQEA